MLKFATPQRLGVPSHRLITSSQRLIERLIKYKELYRNQREEKQSFPKEEFYRIRTFVNQILRILTRSEKTNSFSVLCFRCLKKDCHKITFQRQYPEVVETMRHKK